MKYDFYEFLKLDAQKSGIEKIVVGGIVNNSKGEILLLTRKADDFMPSIDELPSGNLDMGENIRHGLLREINEETGMSVVRINGYINYFDYLSGSGKKARQFNFSITPNTESVILSEHDDFKWQTVEQIRGNKKITPEVKKCIEIYNFNEQMKL